MISDDGEGLFLKGLIVVNETNVKKNIFQNRTAVLASMHKKEEVIAPAMREALDIELIVPEGFNSDEFGTFSGEIKRLGSQLDAARLKAEQALVFSNQTLAIASEGSFGAHPVVPFFPFNREIVLLKDKENDIEIIGMATSTEANFKSSRVYTLDEAQTFAESIGFPETGLIMKAKETSNNNSEIIKGITTVGQLQESFDLLLPLSEDKGVYLETDLRAMYNPKRMKVIEAATKDLVKHMRSLCPECSWPGFQLTERVKGLPCSWCSLPTDLIKAHVYACKKCGYSKRDTFPNGDKTADPGNCNFCNP